LEIPETGGAPSWSPAYFNTRQFGQGAKRLFDICFALTLLVIFAPLLLVLLTAIKLTSPGPVIFKQNRLGKDGRLFPCLKLRTMVIDADVQLENLLRSNAEARLEWERDQKLRNDPRITPIGSFLRRSSLDELPQLWNIFLGQMSVVGPRPIVEAEAVRYGVHLKHYYAVRPGLTGLWQIGGRNDVSYDERVRLDVRYVQSRSFQGDILICIKTLPALIASRGCY